MALEDNVPTRSEVQAIINAERRRAKAEALAPVGPGKPRGKRPTREELTAKVAVQARAAIAENFPKVPQDAIDKIMSDLNSYRVPKRRTQRQV